MSGSMTHGPCDIIGQLLIDKGVAVDPQTAGDWKLGVSEDLATPDEVVSVFDTQGKLQGFEHTQGEMQEQEGILIRIRSKDYRTGYTKAKAIATLLDEGVHNETVVLETVTYIVYSVNRTSGVLHVGKETGASKRHLFTVNATVALTQPSA